MKMQVSLRSHLLHRLWPMVLAAAGVVFAAFWLGYSVAMVPPPVDAWALAAGAWPALCVVLLLTMLVYWVGKQQVLAWVALAHAVQARAPHDGRPLEVPANASPAVQAMAQALNRLWVPASGEGDTQQRFIADAAHQLRTPLAALQSQVEAWALMAQASPAKSIVLSAQQVEQLRQASRRTTQLANQLLVLSRVESQLGQGEQKERVDLQNLCETLLASFLDRALAKDLDLGLEAAAAHVTGHEWLLRELIGNLLDNAIKYTPRGGCVTLRCAKQVADERQMRVVLEVEDDGPGVPVGEYARLTQRFYRAPGAGGEGTGLGLAIAQEIAQGHGADLCFSPGADQRGLKVQLLFDE